MKKEISLLFVFATVTSTVQAQNTFPSSGSVGVGTASPSSLLHIKQSTESSTGALTIERYANSEKLSQYHDGSQWVISPAYSSGGGLSDLIFTSSVGGSEMMRFNHSTLATSFNGGNVGIGTTSPLTTLNVLADKTDENLGQLILAGSSGDKRLSLGINTTGNIGFIQAYKSGTPYYPLALNPNGGNVGIGTTNPVASTQIGAYTSVNSGTVFGVYGTQANGILADFANNSTSKGSFIGYTTTGGVWASRGSGQSLQINTDVTALTVAGTTGNVGIGTTTPSEKLSVNGNIRSQKVIVTQSGWPDYVFTPSFKLKPLSEVAQFINQHQHLPGVPSAKEVEEKGVDVGATEAILLKKMEEMTLYMIEMKKDNQLLQKKIIKLEKQISKL